MDTRPDRPRTTAGMAAAMAWFALLGYGLLAAAILVAVRALTLPGWRMAGLLACAAVIALVAVPFLISYRDMGRRRRAMTESRP